MLERSFQRNDFLCINKNLESSFQLKTFELHDLSNDPFQLHACRPCNPGKDFEKVYRIRIEAEYQKYFTEGKTGHLWNGDHEILNQFLEIRYSNGKIRNVPTQLHQNNRNAPPKRLFGTVNSPSDILTQAGIHGRLTLLLTRFPDCHDMSPSAGNKIHAIFWILFPENALDDDHAFWINLCPYRQILEAESKTRDHYPVHFLETKSRKTYTKLFVLSFLLRNRVFQK